MSKSILEVKNLSKSYRIYSSELWRILSWFGFKKKIIEESYTLQNINFSIYSGEAIGIIGQNGAGKSTLLKIITGTLCSTSGSIVVNGKIAAILELGMGFHPDLSGRQNAYHSAGLMGYTSEQIDSVINDIEAFAEVGEYFDQPVRTYSSGMQMRVAFATVTAYRPEILIVDEALSVGDAYFQHKSFERIRQFQKEGTTLLLVSHDRGAIQAICDRALLLEKGQIIKDGDPEEVMDFYNAIIADRENNNIEQIKLENGKVQTISGTGEAKVEDICLFNVNGEKVEYIGVGEEVELKIKVKIYQNISSLVLGYVIKDRLGQDIYGTNTHHLDKIIKNAKKDEVLIFSFKFDANLGVGSFSITVALHAHDTHIGCNYEWKDQSYVFNVANISRNKFVGLSWMEPKLGVSYVK
ncbi:ABC transporter ATP-binding protein [Aliarcobacter cryaerophilus]|uniref:ABC transporter ATP-binding protein n=1 Tax=Aliarcobacter cryaerophilus TaxID=28198 RepID=UPI003DA6996F